MVLSQGTPFRRSASKPSVISCSTSAADRPRASVWISTKGVENSGSVSTVTCRNARTPKRKTGPRRQGPMTWSANSSQRANARRLTVRKLDLATNLPNLCFKYAMLLAAVDAAVLCCLRLFEMREIAEVIGHLGDRSPGGQKAKLALNLAVTFGVASVRTKGTPASIQMSFFSRPRALFS